MDFIIRFLLLAILVVTPFWGGGRDPFAQEIWLLAAGILGLCVTLAIFFTRSAAPNSTFFSLRRLTHIVSTPTLWAILFAVGIGAAAFFSPAPHLGTMPVLNGVAGVVLFFVSASYLTQERWRVIFALLLIAITGMLALGGIWFYAAGQTDFLTSFFFLPGPFAGWLLLVLPLTAVLGMQEGRRMHKALLASFFILFIIALFLTGVRAGYATAIVAVSLLILVAWRNFGLRRGVVTLALLASAALALGFALALWKGGDMTAAWSRLGFSGEAIDFSTKNRFVFWSGSVNMFFDRPISGFGPGTFGSVWPHYQPNPVTFTRWPHSTLFELLAETGLLGTIPFLLFLFTIFYQFGRGSLILLWSGEAASSALRRRSNFAGTASKISGSLAARDADSPLRLSLAIGLFALTLHSFLDVDFHYPALWGMFWVTAGLLVKSRDPAQPDSSHNAVDAAPLKRQWSRSALLFFIGSTLLIAGSLVQLKAQLLKYLTAQFSGSGHYVAAATLAERAGMVSRNPTDFLQAATWFLQEDSVGEAREQLLSRAETDIQRAQNLDPLDAESFARKAEISFLRKHYTVAAELAEEALGRDHNNHPEYAGLLARIYTVQQGDAAAEAAIDSMLLRYNEEVLAVLAAQARDYYIRGGVFLAGPGEQLFHVAVLLEQKAVLREKHGDYATAGHLRERELSLVERLNPEHMLKSLTP